MSCLKNELQRLKKDFKTHNETLQALKKHPKILKIQELDVIIIFLLIIRMLTSKLGGNKSKY